MNNVSLQSQTFQRVAKHANLFRFLHRVVKVNVLRSPNDDYAILATNHTASFQLQKTVFG